MKVKEERRALIRRKAPIRFLNNGHTGITRLNHADGFLLSAVSSILKPKAITNHVSTIP